MSANDLTKLEKSPPKINTNRKNVKLVNQKVMEAFGEKAFNLSDKLHSQTIDASSAKPAKEDKMFSSITSKSKYDSQKNKHAHKDSTTITPKRKGVSVKKEEVDRRKLLNSLND